MGADIDVPPKASRERMAAKLGPAPAREVLTSLLGWTDYNYLIQASDSDPNGIQSVLLMPRSKSPSLNPTRVAREQVSGWVPTASQANTRKKDETGSDSSDEEQASSSSSAPVGSGTEQVSAASSQSPAATAGTSGSLSNPQTSGDTAAEAPAEIAQSAKSDAADDQAAKNSERMMNLQNLYDQRRQMIEDARKQPGQN